MVTAWQATPLTRGGEVLSYLGGPWGGAVVVAILVVLLLWRRHVRTAVGAWPWPKAAGRPRRS